MMTRRFWTLKALLFSATVLTSQASLAQVRCELLWTSDLTAAAQIPRQRNNIAHSELPTTLDGKWDFAYLTQYATDSGVPGATTLALPTGAAVMIRDLQYALPNGKVGLHLLPTVDRPGEIGSREWKAYPPKGKTHDGVIVEGSKLVDSFLREKFGLDKNDEAAPLFAVLTYTRMIESTSAEFRGLDALAQNRTTHMGAYEGKGLTRHSPYTYAETRGWINSEYPAHVSIVTMKGVAPAVLNRNAQTSMKMLNELNGGVVFPNDYKFDYFRQVNLKEVLDYYRGWVDAKWERLPGEGPYLQRLKRENSFHCYCSEHVTMALNVAVNVPHNLKRYQQIWGETEGAHLFKLAQKRYRETFKEDMPEGEFTPLWERHGIKKPTETTEIGKALVWNPMTVADILRGFMTQYANWQRIGPLMSSLALLKFSDEAQTRLGLAPENYMGMAVPVMSKMFQAHAGRVLSDVPRGALFDAAFAQYVKSTQQGIDMSLAGMGPEAAPVKLVMDSVMKHFSQSKDLIAAQPLRSDRAAKVAFERSIEATLNEAQNIQPKYGIDDSVRTGETFVQHYSPPHIVGLINNGLYRTDPHITLQTVATTLPAAEIRSRPEGPRVVLPEQ